MFDTQCAPIKRIPKCYFLLALFTLLILTVIYATRPSAELKTPSGGQETFAGDGGRVGGSDVVLEGDLAVGDGKNASGKVQISGILSVQDGKVAKGHVRVSGNIRFGGDVEDESGDTGVSHFRRLGDGGSGFYSGNSSFLGVYPLYCDRKTTKISDGCLCYADFHGPTISSMDRKSLKCAMTFHDEGRLGNVIGQYATLLVLARFNGRPAFQTPRMANFLQRHFRLSIPAMTQDMVDDLNWIPLVIHDWMEDSYKAFKGPFLHLGGYPSSYTFFKGFEDELRREFRVGEHVQQRADSVLRKISHHRASTTFVGVHVRRGDYVKKMKEEFHGVLADRKYFVEATEYFRKRYNDAMFVVVSNDMEWCKDNIPNDLGDVYYVGNNNESDPINDFAILVSCNHSIITIGTYSFFSALFAGGETVYFTNYTAHNSVWNTLFRFTSAFPPQWHPIAADLSLLHTNP